MRTIRVLVDKVYSDPHLEAEKQLAIIVAIRKQLAGGIVPPIETLQKETSLVDFVLKACQRLVDFPTLSQEACQGDPMLEMHYYLILEILWILTNISADSDDQLLDAILFRDEEDEDGPLMLDFIKTFMKSSDPKLKSSLVWFLGNIAAHEAIAKVLVESCSFLPWLIELGQQST